ncbi:hypothetical protein Tco_0415028 [Tanacetum coccineum]
MAAFPRLDELAVAAKSRSLFDVMMLYFEREMTNDLEFAADLHNLWFLHQVQQDDSSNSLTTREMIAETYREVHKKIDFVSVMKNIISSDEECATFGSEDTANAHGGRDFQKLLYPEGEIGEGSLIGPELVLQMTDKVVLIKEKLKAARDRQKSYADKRRKLLEFEVGDRVLLKVSPWKGVMRFRKKGKLAPRYVGPFKILERIGLVAYRLRLPEELSSVHDTCHVSNLKKCLADANLHVPLDEIKVDKTLHFVEESVEIMDREIKKLKRRKIVLVKELGYY